MRSPNIKDALDTAANAHDKCLFLRDVLKNAGAITLDGATLRGLGQVFEDVMDKPRGVLVTEVADGSEAEQADVRPGDVILEVNQRTVNSTEDFKKIVAEDGKQKGVVMDTSR